jgi:D-alanyl-D-alanine dipeptidase
VAAGCRPGWLGPLGPLGRVVLGWLAAGQLVACATAAPPAATPPRAGTGPVAAGAPPVAPAPPPVPEGPPIAPDSVATALLVDVRSVVPTARVEVRYATAFNFMGEVLPGYEAQRVLLRREAAESLAVVAADLAQEGLGLKLFDGYRPVRATMAMLAWTRRVQREDLVRDGYIAERSRHNLGLAVDLTLVELASGQELKMGTAFDTFSPAAHTANAAGVFAANRQRLKRAMEARGFRNLPEEWWHYSFDLPDPVRFDLVIR